MTVLQAFVITTDKAGNKKSTIAGVWITNILVEKKNVAALTKTAGAR